MDSFIIRLRWEISRSHSVNNKLTALHVCALRTKQSYFYLMSRTSKITTSFPGSLFFPPNASFRWHRFRLPSIFGSRARSTIFFRHLRSVVLVYLLFLLSITRKNLENHKFDSFNDHCYVYMACRKIIRVEKKDMWAEIMKLHRKIYYLRLKQALRSPFLSSRDSSRQDRRLPLEHINFLSFFPFIMFQLRLR